MKLGEATHEMLIYQRSFVVAAVDPVYFSCSEDLSYSAAFMFYFYFYFILFFWEGVMRYSISCINIASFQAHVNLIIIIIIIRQQQK